jgi:hypothetical protein
MSRTGDCVRHCITVIFLLAISAVAQNNLPKRTNTVNDYCAAISKKVDAMDDTEEDTLLSDLPETERAKLREYLTSLHALRSAIRHDACHARDLKSARATTGRDLRKHSALTDEMLAYAQHAMAEAYRKKTQSGKNSK